MTRLLGRPRPFNGWVAGLVQDAEPDVLPLGSIVEGENLVPLPAGLQQTRGGSRILLTLHNAAAAELDDVLLIHPFTPVGAVAIGHKDAGAGDIHYAYRLTADGAFATGTEATSRVDLSAAPSTTWDTNTARPVVAELFEKLFIADATVDQTDRNEFLSFDTTGTVLRPTFSFAGGGAAALLPYCLEEYNNVLFIAGYGDEGDKDRPEIVRHSYLGTSPDAASGFDADAYILLGAKGQRVTGLRSGRGMLLAAKAHEFYRITGFGRAYPGWQYQVDKVDNTLGLGVANPRAFAFAEGYWYGVGSQGPLRTDGFAVESLAGPRQRGWRAIDKVENAFVVYHPDRRLMLFGVHPSESVSGRSATWPWTLWAWDLERQVWQSDWTFGADFTSVSAITTSTAVGPTAAPTGPSTSLEGPTSYRANWTVGDATAEIEFWEKLGTTGTWTLAVSLPATTAFVVRSHALGHEQYYWKVRHRKNGVTTNYTAETAAKTNITTPIMDAIAVGTGYYVRAFMQSGPTAVTMNLERSAIGAGTFAAYKTTVLPASPTGTYAWSESVAKGFDYRVRGSDSTWSPTTGAYSNTVTVPA